MGRPKGSKNKKPRRTDAALYVYAGADLKAWVASVAGRAAGRSDSETVVAILEAARTGRPWKDALKEWAK